MADDDTPAGFLSRWSRRKAEVREGKAVADPLPGAAPQGPTQASAPTPRGAPSQGKPAAHAPHELAPPTDSSLEPNPASPAPTLDDVQTLTPESDYGPFMARGVRSDVKNAALKKLFTDPHFNVMDRMDVYIDDYGQPDPIPLAMLRQMNGAKFLNLCDEGNPAPATQAPDALRTDASSQLVAQSPPAQPLSSTDTTPHDHADLRLQPDPTPRPEGTGSEPA